MTIFLDQILLINKPKDWTSFDVVKKVKGMLKVKKIGHAGTLDPLATGLLVLALGKKTKDIEKIQALEKEYHATFCIGATTPSLDLETTPSITSDTAHITQDVLESTIQTFFVGEIEQTPPQYSAVKVEGKRAYELARAGKKADIKPKKITIFAFDINNVRTIDASELNPQHTKDQTRLTVFDARIICSKGTYVRTLADDVAQKFGTRGMLLDLVRTRIGTYKLDKADSLESLQKQLDLIHL